MSSTNKTINFDLPQWLGNDFVKRDEMNRAFLIVDDELKKLDDLKTVQGTEAPDNLSNLWLDTTIEPGTLKKYDSVSQLWVEALRQKSDKISVIEFGASPALEDNSQYIQEALNKAHTNGGGTVEMPSGTFKIKQPLIMYSNTTLLMEDSTVLLRNSDMDNMIRNYDDGTDVYTRAATKLAIIGGVLDGNDSVFPNPCASVVFSRVYDARVFNTEFRNNTNSNFIFLVASNYVEVEFCFFHDQNGTNKAEAIRLAAPMNSTVFAWTTLHSDTPNSFVTVRSCRFERILNGIGTHEFGTETHTRITINDNIFLDVLDAISGVNWELVHIRDNHIDLANAGVVLKNEGNGAGGSRVLNYAKIEKNVVRNINKTAYGSIGINVIGSAVSGHYAYVSIKDNSVSSVERHAIEADYLQHSTIDGNTVAITNHSGIWVNACKTTNVINNSAHNCNRAGAGFVAIFIGNTALTTSDTQRITVSNNIAEAIRISRSNIVTVLSNIIELTLFVDTDATNVKRRINWVGSVFEETAG